MFTWLFIDTKIMMTSSNGNVFRITGHLCGKFSGHRWISLTKASDAELWCFFYLICAQINGWVNNREAGDLRCHRAHFFNLKNHALDYNLFINCLTINFNKNATGHNAYLFRLSQASYLTPPPPPPPPPQGTQDATNKSEIPQLQNKIFVISLYWLNLNDVNELY